MKTNTIRLIGGTWRGRRLSFPDVAGLRPTPDRVRETLFNWLQPVIQHATCLDLFAGSGALGFEALSRGAGSVVMIEQSTKIIANLHQQAELLQADHLTIYKGTFPLINKFLQKKKFNIVFLDPPFHQHLIEKSCQWLFEQHCLATNAYIYIEAEKSLQPLPIPNSWRILHSKAAGEVNYYLATNMWEREIRLT